jgi:hypothetical protein
VSSRAVDRSTDSAHGPRLNAATCLREILALVLFATAVLVVGGTTAADAPTHGYDAPTYARVDVHAVRATEEGPTPLSVTREQSASRSAEARRASTTAVAPVVATETEVVQRWMSEAELKATEDSLLVRGGRDGTHYVTDSANSDPLRARQRLSLPQTPEVRVDLEVPKGVFSPPTRVDPDFNMPGGGMERTATGNIPGRVVCVWRPK